MWNSNDVCKPQRVLSSTKLNFDAQTLLRSKVYRYRPSLAKDPHFVERHLEMTSEALLYFRKDPCYSNKAPSLTIPLDQISQARLLYQKQLNLFFFEVILHSTYEQLYLTSKIQTFFHNQSSQGRGYSPTRLSELSFSEVLRKSATPTKVKRLRKNQYEL